MTATAAARALENYPEAVPQPIPAETPVQDPKTGITYQPSLFREGPGSPKVIPIPTLTPSPSRSYEASPIRRVAARSAPRPRYDGYSQQALQFGDDQDLGIAASEMIFCEAPVAQPGYRVLAALVDLSWILIGLGLFIVTVLFLGVDVVINRQTAPFLIAVGVVVMLFYRAVWYFANADTPGMRFAGLRLVDFDGRPPDREQRGLRQIASMLSLVAAGLGLVWALVDEETLTWHDHISKTFPTTS